MCLVNGRWEGHFNFSPVRGKYYLWEVLVPLTRFLILLSLDIAGHCLKGYIKNIVMHLFKWGMWLHLKISGAVLVRLG